MRFTIFAAVLASCAGSALAHTTLFGVLINGVDQGDGQGKYIRSPPNTDPVQDLTSEDMMCNVNNKVVDENVSVKGGDEITFEWHWQDRGDMIIDESHKGPIMVYMGPADGNSWTKLFHEGYEDGWATHKLKETKGQHSVIVPDVPAGNYLFRVEILALHDAHKLNSESSGRGAQFFISCVQVEVTSDGPDALADGVSFPGAYKDSTPGIEFDVYSDEDKFSEYAIPGPEVWSGAKGGGIRRAGEPGERPVAKSTAKPTSATKTSTKSSTKTATIPTPTPEDDEDKASEDSDEKSKPTATKTMTRFITITGTPPMESPITSPTPTSTSGSAKGKASEWEQCGGKDYDGPTSCESGLTCVEHSASYSQCVLMP